MSEAKARELLAALVEAWDSEILAGRFLRLNDAFHAARAYLAAAPAPPAEPTPDPDCVCRGNWRTLVKEYGPLIGKRFRDLHTGEVYMFYGLVHSDDDFYYGLSGGKEGKSRLDSCVGSLKHFYEQVDDAAPATEPVAQPRERNWRWCTSRGYENGERCDDAPDCTKNGCAKGRMLLAGVCPDCNGKGCAACYAP